MYGKFYVSNKVIETEKQDNINDLHKKATASIEMGDVDNANNLLKDIYSLLSKDIYRLIPFNTNLNNLSTLINLSKEFIKIKNFPYAILALDKAIRINPDNVPLFVEKAILQTNMKHYGEALDTINLAISKNPNYTRAHITKGILFENMGCNDEASNCYNAALAMAPEICSDNEDNISKLEIYKLKADFLQNIGKFSEAGKALEEGCVIYPKDAILRLKLVIISKFGSPFTYSKLGQNTEDKSDNTVAVLSDYAPLHCADAVLPVGTPNTLDTLRGYDKIEEKTAASNLSATIREDLFQRLTNISPPISPRIPTHECGSEPEETTNFQIKFIRCGSHLQQAKPSPPEAEIDSCIIRR